jgi:hypothetical protein
MDKQQFDWLVQGRDSALICAYCAFTLRSMKPREVFHLAIRLVGLFFIAYGCIHVWHAWNEISNNHVFFGLLVMIYPFIVGRWLLGGGEPMMRIAFPEENAISGIQQPEWLALAFVAAIGLVILLLRAGH